MKKTILWTILMIFGLAFFSGCTSTQRWPDQQRIAENKMVVIQENIGDGLKTGALSPDQSQMFLTTLKGIRADYSALRDQAVSRDKWDKLQVRLDALGAEINRVLDRSTRPAKFEEPKNADRIVSLQRKIDDGKNSERLPLVEGNTFQDRLDAIRVDYLRITEGGRYATRDERMDISRRLDSLENGLKQFQ